MWIRCLEITGVRNVAQARLEFDPRLNLFLGANGAGKTTVLEALYLLSRARSFRGPGVRSLIADGATCLQVYGELVADDQVTRIGVGRGPRGLDMRLDGQPCDSLAALSACCPMRVVDPSAHELVQGPPEGRRRYLDWGVFHVEPAFLTAWRRYQGALRQRNAALRANPGDRRAVEAWDSELLIQARTVTEARRRYVAGLEGTVGQLLAALAWDGGPVSMVLEPGWPAETDLETALREGWARDRARGFTGVGPHRADLSLRVNHAPAAGRLSRGQQKIMALALLLAQAVRLREDRGRAPILLLDDVVAELDRVRRVAVFELLGRLEGQLFVTAVEVPPEGLAWAGTSREFHVEQGTIQPVV